MGLLSVMADLPCLSETLRVYACRLTKANPLGFFPAATGLDFSPLYRSNGISFCIPARCGATRSGSSRGRQRFHDSICAISQKIVLSPDVIQSRSVRGGPYFPRSTAQLRCQSTPRPFHSTCRGDAGMLARISLHVRRATAGSLVSRVLPSPKESHLRKYVIF